MDYIVERVLPEEGCVLLEREDCSHEAVAMDRFVGTVPRAGDVVRQTNAFYQVDADATQKRRAEMIRRTEALFETREGHHDESKP